MVRLQHHWIVVALFLTISKGSDAQSSTSMQPRPTPTESATVNLPSAPSSDVGEYHSPDGRQQLRNYYYSTFGPPALIAGRSASEGAGAELRSRDRPWHRRPARRSPRRLDLHSGARVMAEAKKYPTPLTNPETATFWEAAKQGKFMIKRCTACGEPHYFPRSICPFCFSDKTVWEESSGEAAIYTFSLMRKSRDRALCDRLCHAEGGAVAADQFRRLRHRQAEDRPEGEGGVQADRRRAAAVLYAGVKLPSPLVGEGGSEGCRMRGSSRRRPTPHPSEFVTSAGVPSPTRGEGASTDAAKREFGRTTQNADQVR